MKAYLVLDFGNEAIARSLTFASQGKTISCVADRSSFHYRRSALPTFADYAVGMRKPIRRDGDRKSKPVGDVRRGDRRGCRIHPALIWLRRSQTVPDST
jgi:hypothetical protein